MGRRGIKVSRVLINKIYDILPEFLQTILINTVKSIKKFFYKLSKLFRRSQNSKPEIIHEFNFNRKYGPLPRVCYAPYTSLFLSRLGYISPCYASYNSDSSHISKESLKTAWFDGSIERIRKKHLNYDFSECSLCKSLLEQKAFGSLLINKYDHYSFSRSSYPRIIEFELSNKCNLSCIMCDSNLSSRIEKTECNNISGNQFYGEKFFEDLEEFIPHLHLAEFTGGDPLIIDEYYRILQLIKKLNPSCSILITTNANTYNEKVEWILNNFKKINFNVSIDSLDAENYSKIRRNGDFNKAIKNLELFIEYSRKNKTYLNILVCPMTVNFHEMADFVNFANEKDICVFFHTVVKPKHLSLKYNRSDSIQENIENFKSLKFPDKTKNQKTNKKNFEDLVNLVEIWQSELELQMRKNQNQFRELSISEMEESLFKKIRGEEKFVNYKMQTILEKYKNNDNYKVLLSKLVAVENQKFIRYLREKETDELLLITEDLIKSTK